MSEYKRPDRPRQGAVGSQRRPVDPQRRGRPQPRRRRRRRVTGRFVAFLVVLAVLCVGAGVLASVLSHRGDEDINTAANPTPAATDALLTADVPDEADEDGVKTLGEAGAEDISQLLGNQDAVIQGLTQEQMVKVDDLSVTPGLDENWMNILLLGSDARSLEESSRTDTMIICSINTSTGEVKLTSILRDTGVNFDDIGQYSNTYRINAANYFGGPELAMKTVNECFGMNIEHYVLVDFTSFSIIAEKLGGIDITISEEEMEQINKNAKQQAKLAAKAGIDESELAATNVLLESYGENTHLNGRQALAYARIRKIDSDISRAERQRKVLVALMEKLKEKNAQEIMSLAMSMFGYVRTNISIDQIISIAATVISSDFDEVEQFRLPINDSYVQETRNEQSMLYDTDWEENTQQLYNFIY